jgi:hypothetical protein
MHICCSTNVIVKVGARDRENRSGLVRQWLTAGHCARPCARIITSVVICQNHVLATTAEYNPVDDPKGQKFFVRTRAQRTVVIATGCVHAWPRNCVLDVHCPCSTLYVHVRTCRREPRTDEGKCLHA